MIYLLDTNVVSDWIVGFRPVMQKVEHILQSGDIVGLCPPVQYEVERGLQAKKLYAKEQIFRQIIRPRLTYFRIMDADWQQAAHLWVITRHQGKQLADIDLLLAALAHRLNAIIASSDRDFDALPVQRENWRDAV